MSSILTNTSAMVALQTLKSINADLSKTQSLISTGKQVANAKDNAALWAISKVMEADVNGFKAINDSLALGESTVATARGSAESITELLKKMQGRIVAAQEENVDRQKIQDDIVALRDQIQSVSTAQFNGLNLLSNTQKTAGTGTVNVLSSIVRSQTGVTSTTIAVGKQDLGIGASAITGAAEVTATNNLTGATDATAVALTGAASPPTTSLTIGGVSAGFGYSIAITAGAGAYATGVNTASANDIRYVARDGDTIQDVAKGLTEAFNRYVERTMGETNRSTVAATVSGATITFTGSSVVGNNLSVTGNGHLATGTTIGGGLEDLATIDVSTAAGAKSALGRIEGLIQTSITAAAAFGSVQGRIETQSNFVGLMMDSLKSGIGSLVDANMEEASARLQALQVQQQLGIQALSIANQAPQSILSLFR